MSMEERVNKKMRDLSGEVSKLQLTVKGTTVRWHVNCRGRCGWGETSLGPDQPSYQNCPECGAMGERRKVIVCVCGDELLLEDSLNQCSCEAKWNLFGQRLTADAQY